MLNWSSYTICYVATLTVYKKNGQWTCSRLQAAHLRLSTDFWRCPQQSSTWSRCLTRSNKLSKIESLKIKFLYYCMPKKSRLFLYRELPYKNGLDLLDTQYESTHYTCSIKQLKIGHLKGKLLWDINICKFHRILLVLFNILSESEVSTCFINLCIADNIILLMTHWVGRWRSYCLPKKSWPISYSLLLFRFGQDFWDNGTMSSV